MMPVKKSSGASRKNRLAKKDSKKKTLTGRPALPVETKRKRNKEQQEIDLKKLEQLDYKSKEWMKCYNRIKKRESRDPLLFKSLKTA